VSYSLSSSPLSPSLTSYSSLCIVQLPGVSVTLRVALTMSQYSPSYSPPFPPRLTCHHNRHHTCRVLLAIILSASYSLSSSPPASSSPSSSSSCSSRHFVFANFPLFPTCRAMLIRSKQHYYLIATMGVTLGACARTAKCGSSIYRCTLDIENRTGLSHYA